HRPRRGEGAEGVLRGPQAFVQHGPLRRHRHDRQDDNLLNAVSAHKGKKKGGGHLCHRYAVGRGRPCIGGDVPVHPGGGSSWDCRQLLLLPFPMSSSDFRLALSVLVGSALNGLCCK
ncbi:unnamed protein product, partial [Ectocarpus fasciculatus]